MKVVLLIPCLMLDNNRKVNNEAMEYAKQYGCNEIVVNDSEFLPEDYKTDFKYIGYHKERQGFVKTRNQLLEWFYNSDYDYALWMDANGKTTGTSLNDLQTLVEAAKAGQLEVDAVFSTLGIMVSGERIFAKKLDNYFENICLVNFSSGYDWMHGLLMKNLNKYYGMKVFIDSRCDPRVGTSEDVFFATMLKRLVDVRLCPTITISKPSNKTSTWMQNEKNYAYKPVDYKTVNAMVDEVIKREGFKPVKQTKKTYWYTRVESNRDALREYKAPKKRQGGLLK